jgi:hypothetical protein
MNALAKSPVTDSWQERLDKRPVWGALAFGMCFFAWSWFATRDGVTIPSGDSVAAIESARSLLEVQRYGWVVWRLTGDGGAVPGGFDVNTIWPPALPALLAGVVWAGAEAATAARWLVVIWTALTAAGSFAVVRMVVHSTRAAAVITGLYLTLFTVQWWVVESFMAEGIYLATTCGGLLLFHRVASRAGPSGIVFLPLGLALALVYYLKSIGPGFMLAGVITVLCLRRWPVKQRVWSAAWLALGCAAGGAPWLLRNLSLGTIGSGGQAIANPVMASMLDLGRLFVPRHGAFMESRLVVALLGLLAVAVMVGAVALVLPRGRMARAGKWLAGIENSGPGAVFALVYMVIFIVAVSVGVALEKTGWVETRYWMEIGLYFLMFGWLAAETGRTELQGVARAAVHTAAIVAAVVIAGSNWMELTRTRSFARQRLPTEAQRRAARAELAHRLKPFDHVTFISNERYRFGFESGLSAIETLAVARKRTDGLDLGKLVYVAYPVPEHATMALVKTPPTVPPGWVSVGPWGEAVLYIAPR